MERTITVSRVSKAGHVPNLDVTLSTALLADAHEEVRSLGSPVRAYGQGLSFAGPALTISGGSLAQWKALDLCQPGQVLVISRGVRTSEAEFGAIYVELAKRRGVAAIITDGLIRDADEIAAIGLPVFASGTHPSSPSDDTPGQIGAPITILGSKVETGDAVFGDADGIAIVPAAALDTVMEKARSQIDVERDMHAYMGQQNVGIPPRIRSAIDEIAIVDGD